MMIFLKFFDKMIFNKIRKRILNHKIFQWFWIKIEKIFAELEKKESWIIIERIFNELEDSKGYHLSNNNLITFVSFITHLAYKFWQKICIKSERFPYWVIWNFEFLHSIRNCLCMIDRKKKIHSLSRGIFFTTREPHRRYPLWVHRVKCCSYTIARKLHRRGNPH